MKCNACTKDAGFYEGVELTICPICSRKIVNDAINRYGKRK